MSGNTGSRDRVQARTGPLPWPLPLPHAGPARRLLGALLLTLGACLALAPTRASAQVDGQVDGIRYSIAPLFPNAGGSWLPTRVELGNDSERPRRIELVISCQENDRNSITWRVDLSPGASKQELLPCPVMFVPWGMISVELYESGKSLTTAPLTTWAINPLQGNSAVLLVHGGAAFPVELRTGIERPFIASDMATIPAALLPAHRQALSAVSLLVLHEVDPERLTPEQRSAVSWLVRSGGTVWVVPGGGGEGNRWLAPIVGELHSRVTTDLRGNSLQVFQTSAADPGRREATVQLAEGELLALLRSYPDGRGTWMRSTTSGALAATAPPRITARPPEPLIRPKDQWEGQARWVSALDRLHRDEIPITWIFGLIVAYLLVVGPGLFLLLRRQGRLIWLLWLQPVIVVLFMGAMFVLGMFNFGLSERGLQTLVVFASPGAARGSGVAVLSHYSSRATQRDFRCRDGTLPQPISNQGAGRALDWVIDDDGTRLVSLPMATWSWTHLIANGPVDLPGSLHLSVNAEDPRSVSFVIENRLPFPVRDPYLVHGRLWLQGEVPAGGRREFLASEARPRRVLGDEDGRRLDLVERIIDEVKRPLLAVRFDPAALVEGTSFDFIESVDQQSGLLVLEEQERP